MSADTSTNPAPAAAAGGASLLMLPDELLLTILSHLDIPDRKHLLIILLRLPFLPHVYHVQYAVITNPSPLPTVLSTTRTSHHLRTLSLDPLLHTHRLQRSSYTLSHSLSLRPSLAELMAHRIYITRTTLAARSLGRNLIKIKLNRQLLKRPSAEELVTKGVLPGECLRGVAPGIVERKRRVERERVKDGLRGWVGEWRRRGGERRDTEGEEKPDVRRLVRRFANSRAGDKEWREGRRREEPARAKVLGLRRFWEKVGREGGVV